MTDAVASPARPADIAPTERSSGYKVYVVAVILIANIFNYADRAILSVLAEPIKRDLGISDAQLGFLYGTSFVLLNGLAALAAARISDAWMRNRLLALGLLVWTGMTALSGLASNLTHLTLARLGVGLGEATLSPVGHSLLADLFVARSRARAFSFYMLGPFVGTALCVAVAGALIAAWPQQCSALGLCGLRPWQAAFLSFGIPGVLVALLVLGIGEPARDVRQRRHARPLRLGADELSLLLPPFAILRLSKLGGPALVRRNLIAAGGIAVVALLLWAVTRDVAQWLTIGFAAYCAITWVQGLPLREPELYRRTVGSPAFNYVLFGIVPAALITASISFWGIPLAIRIFRLSPDAAHGVLGLALGGGALIGTLLGGAIGDALRRRTPIAAIWIGAAGTLVQVLAFGWMLMAPTIGSYAVAMGLMIGAGAVWAAPAASLVQDMLLPTMRSRGATIYALSLTILSLAFGPYSVGRIADATGSLAVGMAAPFVLVPFGLVLLYKAGRAVPDALLRLNGEGIASAPIAERADEATV